ncbi:hypothetical protein RJ55_07524 [Drechmeria coniospora]|nr:hypothetical protein RJ55_07524 [Drechmeria coniospora]
MVLRSLGRSAIAPWVILPAAIPVGYLIYLYWQGHQNTTAVRGHRRKSSPPASGSPPQPHDPISLPAEVKSDSQWVVVYERVVSKPVPIASLSYAINGSPSSRKWRPTQPSPLLREYVRATHKAFSWTPQAMLIRTMVGGKSIRTTFDGTWINSLTFAPGDLVNGIYRVAEHWKDKSSLSERSELMMEVPPSYKGPSVRGLLVAAIEPAPFTDSKRHGESVVFVNETWMWRRTDEKPTLLETSFGRWFHTQLASWLILRGLSAVTGGGCKQ